MLGVDLHVVGRGQGDEEDGPVGTEGLVGPGPDAAHELDGGHAVVGDEDAVDGRPATERPAEVLDLGDRRWLPDRDLAIDGAVDVHAHGGRSGVPHDWPPRSCYSCCW